MAIREVTRGQAGLPCPNSTKSYWHKEPSKALLGHRTTSDLPRTADIVIVGSGISGAFAAHFLKNGRARDAEVVMLEAREACWGATGRNGGHCQPIVYASAPDVAAFELKTFRFLRDLVKSHNIPCDWTSFTGVHTFLTQDLFDLATTVVRELKEKIPELGAEVDVVGPKSGDGEMSEGETTGKPLPTLEDLRIPTANGAVVQANAASLWPYKLVAWVLEWLLREFPAPSFNLQTNTPVTSLRHLDAKLESSPAASAPKAAATEGDDNIGQSYPWLLTTPRGRIATRTVLLCTNAYTSRLLPSFTDLVVPVRGQVAALLPPQSPFSIAATAAGIGTGSYEEAGAAAEVAQLRHSYVFLAQQADGSARDDYLVQRPLPAGELVYGGGRHLAAGLAVGEWHDDIVEDSVARWLRRGLVGVLDLDPTARRVPGQGYGRKAALEDKEVGKEEGEEKEELDATFEWTGIMGYSRDHHPWVGAVPESLGGGDGLWMCGGYTGHGMPAAALCARAVVDMMVGKADGAQVDLPEGFVLTEERVAQARKQDEVAAVEEKGFAALFPRLVSRGHLRQPEWNQPLH